MQNAMSRPTFYATGLVLVYAKKSSNFAGSLVSYGKRDKGEAFYIVKTDVGLQNTSSTKPRNTIAKREVVTNG